MSQRIKQPWREFRSQGVRASDIDKLLKALRALDRTVVEISMSIYKVPRRDRAAMLKHHRRLHDSVRERWSRSLFQPYLALDRFNRAVAHKSDRASLGMRRVAEWLRGGRDQRRRGI